MKPYNMRQLNRAPPARCLEKENTSNSHFVAIPVAIHVGSCYCTFAMGAIICSHTCFVVVRGRRTNHKPLAIIIIAIAI